MEAMSGWAGTSTGAVESAPSVPSAVAKAKGAPTEVSTTLTTKAVARPTPVMDAGGSLPP